MNSLPEDSLPDAPSSSAAEINHGLPSNHHHHHHHHHPMGRFPSLQRRANWLIEGCGKGVTQSADAMDQFCCGYYYHHHHHQQQRRGGRINRATLIFRKIEVTPDRMHDGDGGDSYTAPFTFDTEDDDGDSLLSESEMTYQINLASVWNPFDDDHRSSASLLPPAAYTPLRTETFDTAASDASLITAASYGYSAPVILGYAKKQSNTGRQRLPWAREQMNVTSKRLGPGTTKKADIQQFGPYEQVDPCKEEPKVPQEGTRFDKVESNDQTQHQEAPCFPDARSTRTDSKRVQKGVMCGLNLAPIAMNTGVDDLNIKSHQGSQPLGPSIVSTHQQKWKDPVTNLLDQAEEYAEEHAWKHVSALVSQSSSTSAQNYKDVSDLVSQAAMTSAQNCMNVSALVSDAESASAPNVAILVSETKNNDLLDQSVDEMTDDNVIELTVSSSSSFPMPTICTHKPVAHDDPVEFAQFEVACSTVKPQVQFRPFSNATKHHRLIEI